MTANLTLLLDQGYRPIDVVSWEDAITMLWTDKVDLLEEYEHVIHSPTGTCKPAVIRLRKNFHREVKPVKFSRANIYARDKYRCQYCGERFQAHELTFDHVMPKSRGGKTTWTNIVTACHDCNGWKADMTPDEAGMKLLNKPIEPRAMPETFFEVSRRSIPDAWRDYVYWTGELDQDGDA